MDCQAAGRNMRTVLWAILAFVAGTVATYVAVVGGMLWSMDANRVFGRDGGMAMAIMFAIGPLAGLIGGAICATVVAIWLSRRNLRRGRVAAAPPRAARPQALRVGIAILLAGVPAYLLGRFVLWLYAGTSFASYWAALAVSYAPLILAIATAALAAYLVSRKDASPT